MKRVLSERVAGLKPSGIRLFFEIAATMKDVISLGIGEPDLDTPEPIIQAGVEALNRGETHYTSNHGILVLRQAVADHLKRLYHVEYFPQHEIVMTVGVSEALYLAFTAILNPDDEVIIPTPCFVSYQAEVYFSRRRTCRSSLLTLKTTLYRESNISKQPSPRKPGRFS